MSRRHFRKPARNTITAVILEAAKTQQVETPRSALKMPNCEPRYRSCRLMQTDATGSFDAWSLSEYGPGRIHTNDEVRIWHAAVAWATARERERAAQKVEEYGKYSTQLGALALSGRIAAAIRGKGVLPLSPPLVDDSKAPGAGGKAVGLSIWPGWDASNPPWSAAHHQDSVCRAVFGPSWSMEDGNTLISFIERTWGATDRPDPHPDDLAVDEFAARMKAKLAQKRAEGRGGWESQDICSQADLSRMLREHVEKGDPVDVVNLSMMLSARGERILPAAQPEPHADLVRSAESVWSKWNEDDDDFRHMHEVMAAFAAECAAEWRRRAEAAERAYMATVASRQVYRERAEAAEQELTKIREVLRDIDYASLPDDYPVSKIARVRMTTLNERTKQGLAEIGRYEAAEQALAEEREVAAGLMSTLEAVRSEFRVEYTSDGRFAGSSHDSSAIPLIIGLLDAAIRARKGGEETS
ncbi:hypothetical protein ACUSIJ_17790 [Pseudochelatococcus sp. B33]